MAVRTPHCPSHSTNKSLVMFTVCFLLGKTGYSDSESFSGSLESLSSPGKIRPQTSFLVFLKNSIRLSFYFSSPASQHSPTSTAHVNRRLPKSASTLTVSSDDLDERDMAESGSLLPVHLESLTVDFTLQHSVLYPLTDYTDSQPVKTLSRAALTHRLRKMKSKMVKCKHCEVYIVVSGVECEEVGG